MEVKAYRLRPEPPLLVAMGLYGWLSGVGRGVA
jgi:hypothetical protein